MLPNCAVIRLRGARLHAAHSPTQALDDARLMLSSRLELSSVSFQIGREGTQLIRSVIGHGTARSFPCDALMTRIVDNRVAPRSRRFLQLLRQRSTRLLHITEIAIAGL
jgi:hypothetical protein